MARRDAVALMRLGFVALVAVVSCHPMTAPNGPGALTNATAIVIADEWAGLGCSYHFTAKLERRNNVLVGTASLESARAGTLHHTIIVSLDEVDRLQHMVSEAVKGPELTGDPQAVQVSWTDDYPSGSTTFTGPNGTVKIFFRDQTRKLLIERDGVIQTLEVPDPSASPDSALLFGAPLSPAWKRYRAFLAAVGLTSMLEQQCPRQKPA